MAQAAGAALSLHSANAAGGMPEVVEDAGTFVGNARKKAQALAEKLPADAWALADDSGLCVDVLKGAPGVYSARFAGVNATDAQNNEKLLSLLSNTLGPARTAHFVCVLVLRNKQGEERVAEGKCHGSIIETPKGAQGFGYDPLFCPDGYEETFAQLGSVVKEQLSHRGLAFRRLLEVLRG